MKDYFYTVDIGGTSIKAGLVCKEKILDKTSISSAELKNSSLAEIIKNALLTLEARTGYLINESRGIGIATAGLVDGERGILRFAGNLNIHEYPLKSELEKFFSVPIKIANDADIAALAELRLGKGKNYKNFIFLTIGTGIGGGVILNHEVIGLNLPYSCELGHIKVTDEPILCTCGETGCYEAVASTRALIGQLRSAMLKRKDSKIYEKYTPENIDGKTIFEFLEVDQTAKEVFEQYIENLGTGIVNLVNIFSPEIIFIGGAISASWRYFGKPLTDYVNSHIFVKNIGQKVKIEPATEVGDAGLLGGICLFD